MTKKKTTTRKSKKVDNTGKTLVEIAIENMRNGIYGKPVVPPQKKQKKQGEHDITTDEIELVIEALYGTPKTLKQGLKQCGIANLSEDSEARLLKKIGRCEGCDLWHMLDELSTNMFCHPCEIEDIERENQASYNDYDYYDEDSYD